MRRVRQMFITRMGRECTKYHGKDCVDECDCDIYFQTNSDKFPHPVGQLVLRQEGTIKKNYLTMFEEFLLSVSHRWSIVHGNVEPIKGDSKIVSALNSIAMAVGPNQIPIAPPCQGSMPMSSSYEMNENIVEPYKEWDMKYFAKYCGVTRPRSWWESKIWKEVKGSLYIPGTPWKDEGYTLVERAMRIESFFNKAFCGVSIDGVEYAHSCYSLEDLYPTKIVKLVAKYNKNTHIMPPLMKEHRHILGVAFEAMMKDNGWDQMLGSVLWSYERAVAEVIKITMGASSGIRPGPPERILVGDDDEVIHIGVRGKKLEQILYASKVMDDAVANFYATGDFKLPPAYYKIVLKNEVHCAETVDIAELKKIKEKAREYFIPDMTTILLAQLVQGFRQKIERGDMIQIGRDWNRGGMQDFGDYMLYKDQDMRYITFDISAYDTSVVKSLLEMYSRSALPYMRFENRKDHILYKKMIDMSTQRLTTKVTQMIGNIWRVIDGVMPSGAYETSHGDSWITSIVYYSFLSYLSITDVGFRRKYIQAKKDKKIRLAVYGDDNVLGFPSALSPWMSEHIVARFFLEFANFTIRDYVFHEQFLSVPDGRGGLKRKGVVFLQKYAIETPFKFRKPGMPEIVHYRPVSVNMRKFAKGGGDKRTDFDYFLSSISGVYDNPFNQAWYDACAHFFLKFKQPPGWEYKLEEVLSHSNGYVTRTIRKCNINPLVIKEGFPSFPTLISLSLYNKAHHRNKYREVWADDLTSIGMI